MKYWFGDEVKYEYDLIKPEDNDKLQAFSFGNEQLDYYIQKEMIINGIVDADDGLPFKVWGIKTGDIIKHCRDIAEYKAAARHIILYADKAARRFYERNMFSDFVEFMEKENNNEIAKNEPMYMELD